MSRDEERPGLESCPDRFGNSDGQERPRHQGAGKGQRKRSSKYRSQFKQNYPSAFVFPEACLQSRALIFSASSSGEITVITSS